MISGAVGMYMSDAPKPWKNRPINISQIDGVSQPMNKLGPTRKSAPAIIKMPVWVTLRILNFWERRPAIGDPTTVAKPITENPIPVLSSLIPRLINCTLSTGSINWKAVMAKIRIINALIDRLLLRMVK